MELDDLDKLNTLNQKLDNIILKLIDIEIIDINDNNSKKVLNKLSHISLKIYRLESILKEKKEKINSYLENSQFSF